MALLACLPLVGSAQDFEGLPMPDELFAPPEEGFPEEPVAAPAPAPEPAPVVPVPVTAAPVAGTAEEAFDLKTKALEEKVNDLKEKVFRTKYRLHSLAEAVIGGDPNSGAKLALWHRNELGSTYYLESAVYTLDGAPLYAAVDKDGDLNDAEEFVIFDQRIVPGQHQISVQYELRGNGHGVFSYLEGMRVKLRTSHTFSVEPGKITKLTSLVHEKDGFTLEFADKPDVKFEMNVTKDVARPVEPDVQASSGGARP